MNSHSFQLGIGGRPGVYLLSKQQPTINSPSTRMITQRIGNHRHIANQYTRLWAANPIWLLLAISDVPKWLVVLMERGMLGSRLRIFARCNRTRRLTASISSVAAP
jgi:hypothetical protein